MTVAPTPRNQNLCIWVMSTLPRVDMGSVDDVSEVNVTPIFRVEVSWVSQRSLDTVLFVWTGHLSPQWICWIHPIQFGPEYGGSMYLRNVYNTDRIQTVQRPTIINNNELP
jgi:hypothetical protein